MASWSTKTFWLWFERLGPMVMLVVLILGFSADQGSTFFNAGNLKLILVHSTILATCTLGMTMILISGGLDLSVASSLALSAVAGALVYQQTGSPLAAGLSCIIASSLLGVLNGTLISGFGLNPFIVTLGTLGIGRGIARLLADDSRISLLHSEHGLWQFDILNQNPSFEPWARIGIPPGVLIAVVMILIMVVVMRWTVFGRRVYAIGSNVEAARLCGIKINQTTFMVYALAGFIFGIAGMMQLGFDNAGNPTTREGFELDVIAAVVIGGASLSGGTGTIFGSVIGALIMVVLRNGFGIAGVSAAMQSVVIGAIIVAAVALDMLRQGKLRIPFMR